MTSLPTSPLLWRATCLHGKSCGTTQSGLGTFRVLACVQFTYSLKCMCLYVQVCLHTHLSALLSEPIRVVSSHRQDDIDASIEEQLAQNDGFVDNFARGTAHMFR